MRVAIWNVQSLFMQSKLDVILEMVRMIIDILGISDTNDHTGHHYGVGIIISKFLMDLVTGFLPHSDHIVMLQMLD